MRCQMRGNADWPHTRPATAMRNAEGLVQVQMADISANRTWAGEANLRIHIGAIHINLPALGMHQRADFLDLGFKNAVGAGIGHHQRGKFGAMLIELRLQVINIHITIAVTAHHHHLHARHHGGGRVGAMRR